MKNLLYKELKLIVHPMVIFFCFFGVMLLIPTYPYLVAFIYTLISFTFIFIGGRENNDMYYTCILPVQKKDVVKSRFVTIILIELATIVISIPFAFLSKSINESLIAKGDASGNRMFVDANFTLYAMVFILYGLFNFFFTTKFYKTAKKLLSSFIVSSIVFLTFGVLFEVLIQVIPSLKMMLSNYNNSFLWMRLLILIVGMLIYVGLNILSYHISTKEFEKIDI